ncbi:hypothetical protein [Marinobacter sp. SS13-12]|uniref:hypothetical protein n=1 Tax=Marinobacter sp. SS13-12 TaxID=3050451 RepID=UPI00255560C7|nr:hypothetical protein [Marinobacter sp. SS13-12]MDK8465223.1 hypothetical protein [Marinobacter sp. SS13-12]
MSICPGSPAIEVIHEQFTPMRIPADQDTAMAGVVYPLAADETLCLVLQGFTGAYYSRGKGWGDQARIGGSVTLPLHRPPGEPKATQHIGFDVSP